MAAQLAKDSPNSGARRTYLARWETFSSGYCARLQSTHREHIVYEVRRLAVQSRCQWAAPGGISELDKWSDSNDLRSNIMSAYTAARDARRGLGRSARTWT